MIKTAQLRVYLPVESAAALPVVDSRGGAAAECRPSDGPYGIIGEPMDDDMLSAAWRGRTYVCPRTPLLRVLEGVLAIRQAYRRLGDVPIIPDEVVSSARSRLEDIRREDPEARSHILSSAWHVPFRWLVAFNPQAKEVVGAGGRTTVRYRVGHGEASERLARARAILTGVAAFAPAAAEIGELESWLAGFPADSLVELDYGSIADLFDEDELVTDDSVGDVWAALDALGKGDLTAAVEHRERIAARWAGPVAVGYSS